MKQVLYIFIWFGQAPCQTSSSSVEMRLDVLIRLGAERTENWGRITVEVADKDVRMSGSTSCIYWPAGSDYGFDKALENLEIISDISLETSSMTLLTHCTSIITPTSFPACAVTLPFLTIPDPPSVKLHHSGLLSYAKMAFFADMKLCLVIPQV